MSKPIFKHFRTADADQIILGTKALRSRYAKFWFHALQDMIFAQVWQVLLEQTCVRFLLGILHVNLHNYTTLANFSTKYFILRKVFTDEGDMK